MFFILSYILTANTFYNSKQTLGEKHKLRVFEKRALRRIFGPKRDEMREAG
jgi:hypothetical protein